MRQLEFLALSVEEALYGGAAGGGKTEALLMGGLQYIDVPGYSAGIFRRTKTEMLKPDAPLQRAHAWFHLARLAGLARWDEESATYFFKTRAGAPDSSMHFGHLASERDMGAYQSSAFQYVAVDELTYIKEHHYRFLFSRCRPSNQLLEPVPCRTRGGTNPGGPGHRWVRERFVARAVHVHRGTEAMRDIHARRNGVELPTPALYVSPPSSDAVELARELGRKPRQAYFVPAFAQDNPFLVGEKLSAYRENLMQLDPVRREQLEWGNWDVESTGGFFTDDSFEVVDSMPRIQRWLRSWDLAGTKDDPTTSSNPDWTAGPRMGIHLTPSRLRVLCVDALEHFRDEPPKTQERVVATAQRDGRMVEQLFEQEPGSAGKFVVANWHSLLAGQTVRGIRKTGPKDSYWRPLSGHASNVHKVQLLRGPWNERLVSELKALPVGHDDIADALSQGFSVLVGVVDPGTGSTVARPAGYDSMKGM